MSKKTSLHEEIFASGKLFELVHVTQPDGRVFEIARRAPGVRLIIEDSKAGKLLLTREFRSELDDYDYRLPGGKVFNSLPEYEEFRKSGADILPVAMDKGKGEGLEEAGLVIEDLELIKKSVLGATVEWDLFIFHVTKWQKSDGGQQLEEGEQIDAEDWYSYEQVKEMILKGQMQEERIAFILLQWLAEAQKVNI